jgi:hypothetical protein
MSKKVIPQPYTSSPLLLLLGWGEIRTSSTIFDLGASFALLLSPILKFPVFAEEGSRKVLSDDPEPQCRTWNYFSTI